MKIIKYTDKNYSSLLSELDRRSAPSLEVEQSVKDIIKSVREGGDAALIELTVKYGGPQLKASDLLEVRKPKVDKLVNAALKASYTNVHNFALKSLRKDWKMKNKEGATVGERFDPFQRVGIYVPGGTAPLVSSAIMTVTLAKTAGVPEIVVTTPADVSGKIDDNLLYALRFAGATEIYKVGGAQAIAALTYGTKTIRPVQKIFGPGNEYVVEAKRQVFGSVSVDLLPGPSEIMVIADKTANSSWIASDLLAQAEHGKHSKIILVTDSEKLLVGVQNDINIQLGNLKRQNFLDEVLKSNFEIVLVESISDAINIANNYAPEHVSIAAKNEEKLAKNIMTAGAIFIGSYSAVVAGDFLAGPSHTLPTGGAGKSFSGLTVDMFQRRTSIIKFDKKAIKKSVPVIKIFSDIEGLDAHGESGRVRGE